MKCSVIDDEPMALELIKDYIKKTPFLELGECFTNPIKAMSYLASEHADLVFLDINMPELSGIQLLEALNTPPLVIFTTAYPEYGAESYNYNAVDYLLKPVRYERFLKAVNKASGMLNPKPEKALRQQPDESDSTLFIKSGTKLVKINSSEILFIEGAGNYMIFHTSERKIPSLSTMPEVLEMLPSDRFIRVHKSFIVSVEKIEAVEKHDVIIRGKPIPIGITYRDQFLSRINIK